MMWLFWIALSCTSNTGEPALRTAETAPAVAYRVASAQQLEGPWSNRLDMAQSPYLKMHGQDPVNWYPWGEDAFAEAKRRNVPIFLSIGYYACHWCHVMHRESFKDPTIAAFLNEHFVSIKVDREERPDVDALYMDAVHILNRNQGGWPASIWMTPDGKPFFAGTYFPPETKQGRPGFLELLQRIRGDWNTKPEAMHGFADKTGKRIIERAKNQGLGVVPQGTAADAVRRLLGSWSSVHRGWGTRNQFPMTPVLHFMLWHSVMSDDDNAASLVSGQLSAMDEGGIHDHLGGGFHRYTVDPSWTVPHFEKMLYDNGQLLAAYAEAAVAYKSDRFAQVAQDIGGYLLGQMQHADGGFYSSQSAESKDGEGAFYVWKKEEIAQTLSDPSAFFRAYPFQTNGNFDGSRTVLNRSADVDPETALLQAARKQLLAAREKRDQPPTDRKLVVAWNGLTIGALARAGRLLDKPDFVVAAQRAADRVLAVVKSGYVPRLVATNAPRGVLEDYAFLGNGLLDLYEADGNPKWLNAADQIATTMLERFRDHASGLLYQSDKDVSLLARRADMTDDAEPSGFGRALRLLSRLRSYGSPNASIDVINQGLGQAAWLLERAPNNTVSLVMVAERMARRSKEVVISTPSMEHPTLQGFRDVYNQSIRPHTVLAVVTPETAKELETFAAILGKDPGENGPKAYVCFDGMCKLPTIDVEAFRKQLAE